MNYLKFSILGMFIILVSSCSGSSGHPGIGFIPVILDAYMANYTDSSHVNPQVGDQVVFSMDIQDEGIVSKLVVTVYYPADSETVFEGPQEFTLAGNSSYSQAYSNIGPFTLPGVAGGTYTIGLVLEDRSGGKSASYTINYTLE